ncbi:MAG TPA: serine protein kinase RIO [Candidatus Nanoarchaeia archaeon]|nr:serine protein kinase RIO [Candidatus Nanoarchaeia archaeon]
MAKRSGAKEEHKVWGNVFDPFTQKTVYKLITQGHFEGLQSPISIGKEANIFSALRKDGSKIMAKIYRLETCDFNRMYDYIKSDVRFSHIKKGKRNIVFLWVQREYRNLMKARKAGVNVPIPIAFSNNVLVLEFIGENEIIAPKLKDSEVKDKKAFFDKIVLNMKKLHKVGLVHADLSAFNILNNNQNPVFIDFSQTTTIEDPRAAEYLERDVRNIATYFRKIGLDVDEKKTKEKIIKN